MAGAQESAREETRALKILNPTKLLTAKKLQARGALESRR
jgi:hypothetical protein